MAPPAGPNKRIPWKKHAMNPARFARFSIKDQTLFAKRLSFLVKANVPILESLYILRDQARSRARKHIFEQIIVDVANGKSLSTALSRYKRIFGEFAINLIRVGETSGILAQNLAYLADELQKRDALRRKIVSALVYPVFITVATLGVTGLLTAFIFPKILPVFSSLNVTLPITTKILITGSLFLRAHGALTVALLLLTAIILVVLHKNMAAFRLMSERFLLRVPILGGIIKNYNMANFCRTMGILLKSGIVVTEALDISGTTTHNRLYARHCSLLASHVRKGERISTHLEKHSHFFPSILTHMIAIGEKTGKLSESFLYLSEHYETEVEDLTKNLSNAIEPVLMVFMGILVGFVAVSVITPIYEITKGIRP